MPFTIQEVSNKKDIHSFVNLPFFIYKGNKFWAPPIKKDEAKSLSPETNPAWDFCRAKFWIVLRNGECVGRIGAIINNKYYEKTGETYGRISRAEFIDDYEVSALLFSTAENWLKQQGMTGAYGPLGFTNLDTQGLLVEGFDCLQSVASTYHLPYYKEHYERMGYEKYIDWVEFILHINGIPEKASRLADLIRSRYKLKVIHCKSRNDLLSYSDKVFEVLNQAFSELHFVNAFDKKMEDYYVKKYFNFLNPDYVKIVETEEGAFAGFIIGVPSLSKAMQKANGSLFPFGFIHILKALKKNDRMDLFLTGVDPALQGLGIPAILINEIQKTMDAKGIREVETTGIFEDNHKAITTWKNYEHSQPKRRRCFLKKF